MDLVSLKQEAIRLRVEERKSIREIVPDVPVSKSTLSLWLRPYPLTSEELEHRLKVSRQRRRTTVRGWNSRPNLSKTDLGEACRQMICAKLMLQGFTVFKPVTEDTPVDLLILSNGKYFKCQCKCVYKQGNSTSHALRTKTVRRDGSSHVYTRDEVDVFLGYCLDNDTLYVIPHEEVGGRTVLCIRVLNEPMNADLPQHRWANNYSYLKG